jgi:hypothetical protein
MEENAKTVDAQVKASDETSAKEGRTFTQEEVNSLLARERKSTEAKYSDYVEKAKKFDEFEESQKTELQKANERAEKLQAELDARTKADAVREMKQKVSNELGVPVNLLTGDTEEACRIQAQNIQQYAKSVGYPSVPDGGETKAIGVSKEEILSIKDETKRLKAIAEHIELFQ